MLNKVIIANLHELYNEIWKKNPPACLAEGNKAKIKIRDCQQKKQKQYLCYPFQCCQVWNLYCSEA